MLLKVKGEIECVCVLKSQNEKMMPHSNQSSLGRKDFFSTEREQPCWTCCIFLNAHCAERFEALNTPVHFCQIQEQNDNATDGGKCDDGS